jgi:UDP-glucose 4-epimerase
MTILDQLRGAQLKGTRILVVGGAGFVGSNLCRALVSDSAQVTIIDNLLSSERGNIPASPPIIFIEGSITDEGILKTVCDEYDYLFHLATFHGNQNSIHDPLADHDNNTLTTLKLYEKIKTFRRLKKVVYSSAGCTVAEKTFDQAHATREDAPVSLHMDSPYQISKIIGEMYSNYYFKSYGIPIVKARFQNVYGPGEILGAGKWRGTAATVWRNVTPTFIYRALKRMSLRVEDEGKATRDFIYIEDIVNGLARCALTGKAGEVYNLASGEETPILTLAHLINRFTENPVPIEFAPRREWDLSGKRYGDPTKAQKEINFRATVALETGIARTVEWTRQNLEFIDRCIQKHRVHMSLES